MRGLLDPFNIVRLLAILGVAGCVYIIFYF